MIRTSIVICALVGTATAQAPGNVEDANRAFLEGRELLTSNRTEEACQKFEESIALDPTAPGVMLNLGLCYERLERYATSLFWFRKAQVAAAEAHLPAYEDEAKRHTLALATKVSIVRVDASAAPGVEIRIDDKRIDPIEYARIEVDRGSHELEARADGKPPYQKSFEVTARDGGTLVIPRFVDEVTTPVDTGPSEPAPAPAPRGRIVLAASLGGAGLALCIASPLWARHTKHAYDDAVAAGEMPSYASARTEQHVATGLFVAGAAAVGVAAYLYVTRPAQATTIAPAVDGDQVGLVMSGSF